MNGGQTIIGDILEYPFEKKDCSIKHSGVLGLITGPKSSLTSGQTVTDQSGPLVAVVGEDEARIIPFAHISKIEFIIFSNGIKKPVTAVGHLALTTLPCGAITFIIL